MKKIAALLIVALLTSCGTVNPITNDPQDEQQTNNQTNNNNQTKDEPKSCDTGFYGPDCEPCSCQNGSCNDGIDGDGSCSCNGNWSGENCDQCTGSFWGSDCNKAPTCQHGTPSLGVNGNGHCTSCEAGWAGANCEIAVTCKNGTANDGINGDGHCKECSGNYWGIDCDKTPTCQNGTPSLGVNANGKCTSCKADTGWTGENCNVCDRDLGYGADCKAYGSVTDVDGNVYKTVVIGEQTWMAENYRRTSDVYYECPDGNEEYCETYGALYTHNNICPDGWLVPTKEDFQTLLTFVGGPDYIPSEYALETSKTASDNLRSVSFAEGLDKYGFNALAAGSHYYNNGSWTYGGLGERAVFLTSSSHGPGTRAIFVISEDMAYITGGNHSVSVRCIKN